MDNNPSLSNEELSHTRQEPTLVFSVEQAERVYIKTRTQRAPDVTA